MAAKKRESRNRGLLLDPAKVDQELKRLKIDEHQLSARSGRSVTTIQKIWKRDNIDEGTAEDIAKVLGRDVEFLRLKDDPGNSNDPGTPQEQNAVQEIKTIGDAIGRLYGELVKATHLASDFRAQAIASVHAISAELVLMDAIPEGEINGRVGRSLIITFPISRRDAQTLMSAFIAGRLEKFDIKSAAISSEPFANPETERAKSLWEATPFKYSVGQVVDVVVSFLGDFGAYVELEPGITGLIHISELAFPIFVIEGAMTDPRDVLKVGQRIKAKIISIDTQHQRIQLSRKALIIPPKPTATPNQ